MPIIVQNDVTGEQRPIDQADDPAARGVIRTVGGLVFDVTVSESQIDTLSITDHPIQEGAVISDHAYLEPREVTVIVGKGAKEGEEIPQEMYVQLKELQAKREPFDITTGKDEYTNMLLKSISVMTDATTEHVLLATLVCREVILVETEEATVAGGNNSKGKGKASQADSKTASQQDGGSKQATPDTENESGISKAWNAITGAFGGGK